MNNKGQSVLSEYVMIFFVVIAAAVAVTTLVQRALEARVHDARNFAMDSVMSSGACDANCVQAAGGNVSHEYEPYYSIALSDVQHSSAEAGTEQQGNAQVLGAIYTKSTSDTTQTNSTSVQLPPGCNTAADCAQLVGG